MAILELSGISKHFGAIQALTDVSLALHAGEVVGLMGDNGAGKSTLVKIIAGNYPPSSGTIQMLGRKVAFHKPADARAEGIEIVYQDLALCNNLTSAANVYLGRELERGVRPFRVLNYRTMFQRAAELFAELKSETRPRDLVRRMSGGQRQAVAIARTRLSEPKIVLMDEPTAAISVRQVSRGAESHPQAARPQHCGCSHQSPHAGRIRGGGSNHRDEARRKSRRQGDLRQLPRRGDGSHHRRNRVRLRGLRATDTRGKQDHGYDSRGIHSRAGAWQPAELDRQPADILGIGGRRARLGHSVSVQRCLRDAAEPVQRHPQLRLRGHHRHRHDRRHHHRRHRPLGRGGAGAVRNGHRHAR